MAMIQIKLWGGLCNQMFQYSFGYVLAKKNNSSLCFDLDFYKSQPKYVSKRQECLRKFFPNISLNVQSRPKTVLFFERKLVNHILYRMFKRKWKVSKNTLFFKEKKFKYYLSIPFEKDVLNYYDGYWQTEEYFREFESEIRSLFTPKFEIMSKVNFWLDKSSNLPKIALHVRRGDLFGKNKSGYNKILNYYKRAISYISNEIGAFTLYVLSDDVSWCKNNLHLTENKTIYVENEGEDAPIIDLFIIAKCDHGIMSPSTFSWWGNWLGDAEKKRVVIAPKENYFNEKFIPDRWLKI